jgi:hypothetical protein
MDELEQLEEFSALMESMEMPDHLKTALMEAFYHTYHVDRRPMTDEEMELRLDAMEAGSKKLGMPFDRAAVKEDMKKYPGKYRSKPIPRQPMNVEKDMHNSQLNVLNQDEARKAYYKAFVKRVAQIYNHFHIPFDADGYYEYICAKDNENTPEVDAANAKSVVFKSFDEMIKNPDIQKLMISNKSLTELEKKCYKFLVGLRNAKEKGNESSFLSWCRISGDVQKAPTIEKPDARLTADDQKAFDEKEAIAKAMAERANMPKNLSARVGSIAEMRKHFPRLPYARLYERFANGGDPAKVEQAPKPDESISNYLYRMKRGGVPMDTFLRMHIADINTAYPPEAAERALNQLRYTGYVEGAEREVAEMGIDPSLQKLAALCRVIEDMREAKERHNFQFTLP